MLSANGGSDKGFRLYRTSDGYRVSLRMVWKVRFQFLGTVEWKGLARSARAYEITKYILIAL
jgi:hypothetical protein